MKIVIGNKSYSSWSLRGWLAVKQSGLPFEERLIPMWSDEWEAAQGELAVSGGKVPTLIDGEAVVWDSLAILEYLNEKTGNMRFWPKDGVARGLARSMAAEMHSSYVALRNEHGMNTRRTHPARPVSEAVAKDLSRILHLWRQARESYGQGGAFLFGEFGAADIMFAPVCTRIRTYSLPVEPFAVDYVNAVYDHPFMKEWLAAADAEEWVIDKYETY
ncbi:MAG TPA: glutathione S-transferase family protein [Sphingomonas sp.]|jgi:glutathione S-transferase|nr:glutathione S-transferase family protein [Sphingomonas sp.]